MRRNLQDFFKKNEGKTSIIGLICLALLLVALSSIVTPVFDNSGAVFGSGTSCAHVWLTGATKKNATCTSARVDVQYCRQCGATKEVTVGSALGHNWNSATCTTPQTCSRCGKTYGQPLGHNYLLTAETKATCTLRGTKQYTCQRCYDVYYTNTDALGHDYADATCDSPKKCKRCGTTSGSALGHDFVADARSSVSATCTTAGVRVSICSRCQKVNRENVAALGHDYAAATCTAPKTCKRCQTTEGKALGHSYKSGKCSRCGAYCPHTSTTGKPVQTGSSTTHDIQTVCNTCGLTVKTVQTGVPHSFNSNGVCTGCGYTDKVIKAKLECAAKGHTWNTNGLCSNCGTACSHSWNATTGKCKTCNMTCNHTFDASTGRCSICGYSKPATSTPKPTTCPHTSTTGKPVQTGSSTTHDIKTVCNKCGAEVKTVQTGVPHSFDSKGICTGCGYVCKHSSVSGWKYDGNNHWKVCNTCGVKTNYAGHAPLGAKCNTCGYSPAATPTPKPSGTCSPASAHSWQTGATKKAATCTTARVDQQYCTKCGATRETSVGSALGHSWKEGSWVAYASTTDGKDPTIYHKKHSTCTRCKMEKDEYQAHTYSNGVCTVCKYKQPATSTPKPAGTCSPASAHSWQTGATKKAATCTTARVDQQYCTKCGATRETSVGSALGHSWKEGSWVAYASTTDGKDPTIYHKKHSTCTRCKMEKDEYQAHTFSNGVCTVCKYKQPTPTAHKHTIGQKKYIYLHSTQHNVEYYCATCGQLYNTVTEMHNNLGKTPICTLCNVPGHTHVWKEWYEDYSNTQHMVNETCSCGVTNNNVRKEAHTYGAWKKVTSTKEERECTKCGHKETRTVTATPKPTATKKPTNTPKPTTSAPVNKVLTISGPAWVYVGDTITLTLSPSGVTAQWTVSQGGNGGQGTLGSTNKANSNTFKGNHVGWVNVSASATGYNTASHNIEIIARSTNTPTTTKAPVPTTTNAPVPTTTQAPTTTPSGGDEITPTPTKAPTPTPVPTDTDKPKVVGGSATIKKNEKLTTGKFKVSDNVGVTKLSTEVKPSHGTVTNLKLDGTFTYTPNKDYVGVDSFKVVATDKAGNKSDPATFTITVTDDTEAPKVGDLEGTTNKNVKFTGTVPVSDNVGVTKLVVATNPLHGKVTKINKDGTITYEPEKDFLGTDVFTVYAEDKEGNRSNTGTVTIHVVEPGTQDTQKPTGNDTTEYTDQDTPLNANIDGQDNVGVEKILLIENPKHGTANDNKPEWPSLAYVYVPEPGFYGWDEFKVQIVDAAGNKSDPITVRIYVRKKLEESDIIAKKYKIIDIHMNETYTSRALPAKDYNDDEIKYYVYVEPNDGQVSVTSDRKIEYIPKRDSLKTDYFTIIADNGHEYVLIEFTVIIHETGEEIVDNHIWYIRGYPDFTVKPDGIVTREELATIIYRIDTDSTEPYAVSRVTYWDVEPDRWSYNAIMYLTNLDVLSGYPDGSFRPSQTMTRAEFASVISRYANLTSSTISPYSDIAQDHWARNVIAKVTSRGFFTDDENGYFGPEVALSRGYATRVINRLLERNDSNAHVTDIPFYDLPESHPYYNNMVEAFTSHTCTEDEYGNEIWKDHSYPYLNY